MTILARLRTSTSRSTRQVTRIRYSAGMPSRRHRATSALACVVVAAALGTPPAHASAFDHSDWDRILRTRVDAEGRVAYRDLQVEDGAAFERYLARLALAEPTDWTRNEQLAFWINAYNAGIISAILHGQSAESLIGRGKIFKFWKFEVAGKKRTLDEIEHKILRPQFDEARIHFAIVCASTSCPKLRPEAFVAEKLEVQLEEQAHSFINDPLRNRIDPTGDGVHLSKIFDWFREDFERQGSLLEYLAQYVIDAETGDWLRSNAQSVKIDHLDYDWSLNVQPDQRPKKRSRAALKRQRGR